MNTASLCRAEYRSHYNGKRCRRSTNATQVPRMKYSQVCVCLYGGCLVSSLVCAVGDTGIANAYGSLSEDWYIGEVEDGGLRSTASESHHEKPSAIEGPIDISCSCTLTKHRPASLNFGVPFKSCNLQTRSTALCEEVRRQPLEYKVL